jgi:oligosaccharide repeat unit polymerase
MENKSILFLTPLSFALVVFAINIAGGPLDLQIIILLAFVIATLIPFRFDAFHPYVILAPFVFAYHMPVLILDALGLRDASGSDQIIILTLLFLVVMYVYFSMASKPNDSRVNFMMRINSFKIPKLIIKLMYWGGVFIVSGSIILFAISGISTKSEASASNAFDFGYFHKFYIYTYLLLLVHVLIKDENPRLLLFSGLVLTILISIILGERDIFLSLVIGSILVLHKLNKLKKQQVYFLGALIVILIPVLGVVKNILSKDVAESFVDFNFMTSLLYGEFLSAGRNLETILTPSGQWGMFYGETFVWDVLRALVPSFIFPIQNPVSWFNTTFHSDIVMEGRGYGFSLIAEGYINFGVAGVILWSYLFSYTINFFYLRSMRNIYWLVAYVFLIPIFIYVLRADFSNLISPIIKQLLIFTALFLTMSRLSRHANHS